MAKQQKPDKEFKYWIALDTIQGLGCKNFNLLLKHFGSLESAWRATPKKLEKSGLNERLIAKIKHLRDKSDPDEFVKQLETLKMKAVCRYSDDYPALLKQIYDPPNTLYYAGSLDFDALRSVAVVGTRLPTAYGKRAAERIVRDLTDAGVTIISGLARGIDSIAHTVTLEARGKTVAVLGGALNKLYPADHKPLARDIVQSGGAVVTEFPPHVRSLRQFFPRRNRIISGLVAGVVVVEGKTTSGALITARLGLEQGRDVFAVPGNISDEKSGGPNELIKESRAKLITDAEDVLEELNLRAFVAPRQEPSPAVQIKLDDGFSEVEKQIWQALRKAEQPMHVDELARTVGKPISEINTSVVMLELSDKVKRVAAMTFAPL